MLKNNIKGVFTSLLIIGCLVLALTYIFLNVYLPYQTNKNAVSVVPDLLGMDLRNATTILKEKNLMLEIMTDSGYNVELPKLAVIEQFPKAESKVKIERTVHLRLNAKIPPLISYPDLNGASVDLATKQLALLNLVVDSLLYVPDIAVNTIIESQSSGKVLTAGEKIRKGSHIKLFVGSKSDSLIQKKL
jgi:beta-lactam-binding protein with PASTA domain